MCVCSRLCVCAACIVVSRRCSSSISARLPWQLESGCFGVRWHDIIELRHSFMKWPIGATAFDLLQIFCQYNITFSTTKPISVQELDNNLYSDITSWNFNDRPRLPTLSSNVYCDRWPHSSGHSETITQMSSYFNLWRPKHCSSYTDQILSSQFNLGWPCLSAVNVMSYKQPAFDLIWFDFQYKALSQYI